MDFSRIQACAPYVGRIQNVATAVGKCQRTRFARGSFTGFHQRDVKALALCQQRKGGADGSRADDDNVRAMVNLQLIHKRDTKRELAPPPRN